MAPDSPARTRHFSRSSTASTARHTPRAARDCLQKVMTLMARSSPSLFELLEAWTLDDHYN